MSLINHRVITDISGESSYLERWSLTIPLIGWTLKLHKITRADDDRCQHDHPWWFIRVVIYGGYDELVGEKNELKKRWIGNISFCNRNFRHRIIRLYSKASWSIVLTGRNNGLWGFYTSIGYMAWRDFVDQMRSKRILWCDDGSEPKQ